SGLLEPHSQSDFTDELAGNANVCLAHKYPDISSTPYRRRHGWHGNQKHVFPSPILKLRFEPRLEVHGDITIQLSLFDPTNRADSRAQQSYMASPRLRRKYHI